MKKLLVVCLGVLLVWSVALGSPNKSEVFTLADQVGEPNALSFFVFSTSAGKYILRYDGTGEFASKNEVRRRVFSVKVAAKSRIRSVYFLEHESDLLLLYEVNDNAYLIRVEQTKRKQRWSTSFAGSNVEAPVVNGDLIIIKESDRTIEISKADGRTIKTGLENSQDLVWETL